MVTTITITPRVVSTTRTTLTTITLIEAVRMDGTTMRMADTTHLARASEIQTTDQDIDLTV